MLRWFCHTISMQTMGRVERMPYSAWPQKPLAPQHQSPGATAAWEWSAVQAWGNWGCIQKRGLTQSDKRAWGFFPLSISPTIFLPHEWSSSVKCWMILLDTQLLIFLLLSLHNISCVSQNLYNDLCFCYLFTSVFLNIDSAVIVHLHLIFLSFHPVLY